MNASSFNSVLFLRWLVISIAIGMAIAVALVIVVDPYGLYRVVNRPGLNLIKPGLTRYQNEIKLSHAIALRADTFIMGNSRAEIGFDPDASALAQCCASRYNLAIPGIGIDTSRRQLEYLLHVGIKPRLIVMGIDFLDFLALPQKTPAAKTSADPSDAGYPIEQWLWRFDTLFSVASVKDALRTLTIQHDADAETISPSGFNPLHEYWSMARNEGYYVLFRQREQENARTYLKLAKGALELTDLSQLRAILDMAARSESDLKLIIYPYHAQILALFEETGLWPAFEQWKDAVIGEVVAARRRHPDVHVALFDFSGYGSYNCEHIPAEGDRKTVTRWYWEAGHFKKELGDVVLDQVLSAPVNSRRIAGIGTDPASVFGMRLDATTRTSNRQRIDRERAECLRVYPELFTETAELVMRMRNR